MKGRSGLTGWDLLAIVVVIVTLAAILFPVFMRSGHSDIEVCRSRLRQLSHAVISYADDYDGRFPPQDRWCDAVGPRLQRPVVLKCPTATDQRCGYAYSAKMPPTRKEASQPESTPMLFDARGDWNMVGGADIAIWRHGNGLSIAFADGHTEWSRDIRFPERTGR